MVFIPSVAYNIRREAEQYGLEPWMDGIAFAGEQNLREADMTFQRVFPVYGDAFSSFLDKISVENFENEHYHEYAEDQYLTVPDHLIEPITALAQEITVGLEDDYSRVIAIQNYLSANYHYTTDPGDENQGDPVPYFLFESHQGYCAHYASSMVLLTRSLGIPARSVEGYMVPPDRDGSITVMDSNAHSWPEVYFPSIGWLPFEPTTGYGPTAPPVEEPASSSTVQGASSVASSPSSQSASSPPVTSSTSNRGSTSIAVAAPGHTVHAWSIVLLSCCILFLILIALVVSCSIHFKRIHRFSPEDPYAVQKLAAFMMIQLERLGLVREKGELPSSFASRVDARFRGKFHPSFQDCVALILKDRFSASPLTQQETEQVFLYAEQLCKVLSETVSPIRRFWYRYILHLLGPLR